MKNNKYSISVIIPIYNTPIDFFRKCIESIFENTYAPAEVVAVNDGSTQANTELYEELASEYPQLKIYTKENEGVSVARNYGVKKSSGDYICFIDADDVVSADFFCEAVDIINASKADIVVGNIRVDEDKYICKIENDAVFHNKTDASKALLAGLSHVQSPDGIKISGSPCGRVFSRKIIESVEFDRNVHFYEDQLYNIKAFRNAGVVSVTSHTWYIYNQNDFSAIHNKLEKNHAELLIPFFDELLVLIGDERYSDIRHDLIVYGMDILINAYKYTYKHKDGLSKQEVRATVNKVKRSAFSAFLQHEKISLSDLSSREKIKYLLIKLHLQKLIRFF